MNPVDIQLEGYYIQWTLINDTSKKEFYNGFH